MNGLEVRSRLGNLFTLADLTDTEIVEILDLAETMTPFARTSCIPSFAPKRQVPAGMPEGTKARQIELVLLILERSLRTWGTSRTAALNLGWLVRQILGTEQTSIPKGEGFTHTIMMIVGCQMADMLAMRTTEEGAARYAAEVIAGMHHIFGREMPFHVPVINLGDGRHGHPTQGLLDLLSIRRQLGRLDNFILGLIGDPGLSRTGAELLRAAAIFGFEVRLFCRPDALPPANWLQEVKYSHSPNWEGIGECDVLNWIRPQDERSKLDPLEYLRRMRQWRLAVPVQKKLKPGVIHQHAQPIKDQGDLIPVFPGMYEDDAFRSIQFQATGGLEIRMAVPCVLWANRRESIVIPEFPEEVTAIPAEQQPVEEKMQRLAEKHRGRGRNFEPVSSGMVWDHFYVEEANLVYQWLLHLGLISRIDKVFPIPSTTRKPEFDGYKSVLVFDHVFLDKRIMACLSLVFPTVVWNVAKDGVFTKYRGFGPPSSTLPGILPCPNPSCITNREAQAEARLHVSPGGRLVCCYCERLFDQSEIVDKIKAIVNPVQVRGLEPSAVRVSEG